ncbi:hypothetical protein Nepgr_033395 [Nepenthes gracilis]|uniref:Uncharacterized protein n=1 Tax=Nepenthes gracilis TaxID=150966 RepID=A0AAD3TLZ1_NEPGR|nr:hypothetical protein Nepgr_033395 [Nepenthes gracilis]
MASYGTRGNDARRRETGDVGTLSVVQAYEGRMVTEKNLDVDAVGAAGEILIPDLDSGAVGVGEQCVTPMNRG